MDRVTYYEQPPDKSEQPGCLDAIVITRVVFGVLLIPFLLMMSVVIAVALAFLLYGVHPALALIPIAATIGAVWAYAVWEQKRYRPPDL